MPQDRHQSRRTPVIAVCTESNVIVLSFKSEKESLPNLPTYDFPSLSGCTLHRVTFELSGFRRRSDGTHYWRFVESDRRVLICGSHFGLR